MPRRAPAVLLPAAALVVGCAGRLPPELPAAERLRGDAALIAQSAKGGELPALTPSSTLDDYVRYAALNNPGLKAAFEAWQAALARVPQVSTLPEPVMKVAYYLEAVETRVGPQRWRLGASQGFPWPGKLTLRGNIAAAEAEAARQRFENLRLKLSYRVKTVYYELYYLGRAIDITKENIELVKYIEEVARARYRVAGGEYADVVRTQVELGKLQDRLRTLEAMKRPLGAELNAALNRPTDATVPLPARAPAESAAIGPREAIEWLGENSPELRALAAEVEKARAGVELARKNYHPDFSVGMSYIETGSARMPTSDSGKDPVVVELGFTVPLWRGKYRAAEREAQARLARARHARAEKRNTLASAIELGFFRLRDAERKVELYRDTLVPKARQSLEATETAYKGAKASLADVIDAERLLLAFRLELRRAFADRAQRLAELEMLVGREIPRRVTPGPRPQEGGEPGQTPEGTGEQEKEKM